MTAQIQRITLGSGDRVRAGNFYRALGWTGQPGDDPGVLRIGEAAVLELEDWQALAATAGVSPATRGFRGMTLSAIFDSAEEVDRFLRAATAAGGTPVKPARGAFWGYSGHVADPDGHLWKAACAGSPLAAGRRRRSDRAGDPPARPKEVAVTLAAADLRRARSFYEAGLSFPVDRSFGKFTSFATAPHSVSFGLYRRDALAADAGVAAEGEGFGGFALTCVVPSEAQVAATLTAAGRAGGRVLAPVGAGSPEATGGRAVDTDGHLWIVSAQRRP